MLAKAISVISTIENWPMVAVDKFFGGPNIEYRLRSGVTVECRTRSSDVHEVVLVLSGDEYPDESVRLPAGRPVTVVDLGANIGTFALHCARLNADRDVRGFAFEPHPGNADLLARNLARNGCTRFEVLRSAVGGATGTCRLDTAANYDMFRLDADAEHFVEVPVVRLSEFCAQRGIEQIDLLKMDIEGGEYALFDADLPFLGSRVSRMLIEYHDLDAQRNGETVRRLLGDAFTLRTWKTFDSCGILIAENRRLAG